MAIFRPIENENWKGFEVNANHEELMQGLGLPGWVSDTVTSIFGEIEADFTVSQVGAALIANRFNQKGVKVNVKKDIDLTLIGDKWQ